MFKYTVSRLLQATVTLFFIALITFALMQAVPGGPFVSLAGERGVSEEFVARQEAFYGLNDPIYQQFTTYISNLVQGDLGISLVAQRGTPVTDILRDKAKPSLILGLMALGIVLIAAVPIGAFTAIRKNSRWDVTGLVASTALGAVPSFVLAFVLLIVFAVWLDVFDVRLGRGFGDSLGSLKNGILPALALGAPATALIARLTRAQMLEVLEMDYIRTARAKGLSNRGVYIRHALRNALIPVLTLTGPLFAELITGSIIIEQIFGIPGIGSLFVTSIFQRDYGIIMGTTLFFATAIMLANLAVDLTYPLLDPRVKLAR
jgi:oligopeptide transport system permease protein